jgi:peptidoglycan/xylan/chitin deacetylase (PgdA/CDA1 family)
MRQISAFKEFCASVGWRLPGLRRLGSYQPMVAIYHSVSRKDNSIYPNAAEFEKQMMFCKRYFRFVGFDEYAHTRNSNEKIEILLTFDDGLMNNYEVVTPILQYYNIPAVFFVCSRHAQPGKYLWFVYKRMLLDYYPYATVEIDGRTYDMRVQCRQQTVKLLFDDMMKREPYPAALYEAIDCLFPRLESFIEEDVLIDRARGMSDSQIRSIAEQPLFKIGLHTADHPYLTLCNEHVIAEQVEKNREWVRGATGQQCDIMAYPGGTYNSRVLTACGKLGIRHGFVIRRYPADWRRHDERPLEIPRVGVYNASLNLLGLKCQWGDLLRGTGLRFG